MTGFPSERGPAPSRSDSLPLGARRPPSTGDPSDRPRQFGPFRLQRELGRGANGVVYLARRIDDSRSLALKILLADAGDAEGLARFELEAQIAGKLRHPGIVRVRDAGRVGGHRYCALDYCEGPTLKERIRAEGSLAPEAAAEIAIKLCRALDYAHGEGVLHRDVKPANVLLEDGEPRLTDFGLARDQLLSRSLTRTGDVLGTPAFMAPEQLRGQRDVDVRADIYALGSTLYQCLTGQPPYRADTVPELVRVVLAGGAPSPTALNPAVPAALGAVVLRAIAVERGKRYTSAGLFGDDLEAALGRGAATPGEQRRRSGALLFPVAGVAIGLLVGLLGYVLFFAAEPELESHAAAAEVEPEDDPPPAPTVTPPTRALAPDAELRVLGDLLTDQFRLVREYGLGDIWATFSPRLETLRIEFPDDPRLPVFAAYREAATRRSSTLELTRAVRELGRDDPLLPPTFAGVVGRFAGSIGFERLGRDLVEASAGEGFVHPWAGLSLMHLRAKTLPPVRDVEAACAAAAETLRVLEAEDRLKDPAANPPAWDVYINLALYRMFLDDGEAAVNAARRAVAVAPSDRAGYLGRLRRELESGYVVPAAALDKISGLFGADALAQVITPSRSRIGLGQPLREAERLERALSQFERDPPSAALIEVSAARALARGGERARAVRVLERARGRLSGRADDVRQLVDRVLARILLDLDRDLDRALELARGVTAVPGLSRGERVDAWLLTARALRRQGDASGAKRALQKANALAPYDRRELEAMLGE